MEKNNFEKRLREKTHKTILAARSIVCVHPKGDRPERSTDVYDIKEHEAVVPESPMPDKEDINDNLVS